jgi:hypothetical protein
MRSLKRALIVQFALCMVNAMLLVFILAGVANSATELAHVDFDNDISGQLPATGGLNQPTDLFSQPGSSVLVQDQSNGIYTQPVVLTVQNAGAYADVRTLFDLISEGTVRIEATVAFDRLADGYFLQTIAGSGSSPSAVVTRLIMRDFGEIQDDVTRTYVGSYSPNQPFHLRMDIDMTEDEWSVAIDNELNGFDDDTVVSNLPFTNPTDSLPTVGGVIASLNLFPTLSVAPTTVSYDDIHVPAVFVNIMANDSSGPLTIKAEDLLDITITVSPAPVAQAGLPADWWVAASTPMGIYWFTQANGWNPSESPQRAYDGPLFNLSSYSILSTSGLPKGDYIFYFAVDDNQDGNLDAHYIDYAKVTIQ